MLLLITFFPVFSLHFPLDKFDGISSTFGEYRGSRLHAGIDLLCYHREGLPVYAVFSGKIVRMGASRYGYGNVLYLENNSGEIAVYGHLSAFENDKLGLENLLDDIRKRKGVRYPIDYYIPAKKQVFVKEGQLIGYTGQTGAGGTHLHMEMRHGMECPFNAIGEFLSPSQDSNSPIFNNIIIIPVDSGSDIDGIPGPAKINFTETGTSKFTGDKVVSLSKGRFKFIVFVWDGDDKLYYHTGIYKLKFYLDSKEITSYTFSKFKYGVLDYGLIFDLKRSHSGNFYYNINIPSQIKLFGCLDKSMPVVEMDGATHEINLKASDYFGNVSTASLKILPVKSKKIKIFKNNFILLDNALVVKKEYSVFPLLQRSNTSETFTGYNIKKSGKYILKNDYENNEIFLFNPSENNDLHFNNIKVKTSKNSAYLNHWEAITIEHGKEDFKLTPFSERYRFMNGYHLLRSPAEISIKPDNKVIIRKKLGIYEKNHGLWSYRTDSRWSGDSMNIKVKYFTEYALFYDDIIPDIYFDKNLKEFCISDYGSGISPDSIKTFINGKKILCDYDPENYRLLFNTKLISSFSVKQGILSVYAKDRAGNKKKKSFKIRIAKGKIFPYDE